MASDAKYKVQFGSGPIACENWLNYDCSPTMRIQRIPLVGPIARRRMTTVFDDKVLYGDTRSGLPLADSSVSFLYCSHVLEHLSLEDFRLTLKDCYRILVPGGVFRGVMPDLEAVIAKYQNDDAPNACSRMMESSYLATVSRPRGLVGLAKMLWGNSRHLWLWDYKGTKEELETAGFANVRRAQFGDSVYPEFRNIEVFESWDKQLGFECTKRG
jgi:predicted SAM-dependent methyltransferase